MSLQLGIVKVSPGFRGGTEKGEKAIEWKQSLEWWHGKKSSKNIEVAAEEVNQDTKAASVDMFV